MHAILITVDAGYVALLHVFLECLQRNYPNHPQVLVCTSDWPPGLRERVERRFSSLRWLDATALEFPSGPPMRGGLSIDCPIMYARLAALGAAFDTFDTILYLDVDTLVLAPLDELLSADRLMVFEESYTDRATQVFQDPSDPVLRALLREDGIDDREWRAANAGVIAIPHGDRRLEHATEARRLTERYGPYLKWADQSVLNLWLARNGRRAVRDFRFNYQVRLIQERRERDLYRQARILHFNGQHGTMPFLMQVAYLITCLPGGRLVLPAALRFLTRPDLDALRGYRLRRWLRRRFERMME